MKFEAKITVGRADGMTEQRGTYSGYHIWSALLSAIRDTEAKLGDTSLTISIKQAEDEKCIHIPVKCGCCQ